MTDCSRIPHFYKLTVQERLHMLQERGFLQPGDVQLLHQQQQLLSLHHADKMVENVIGVFGLPFGLGLNFLINNRDYVIPMVVEEASIIAALSSAAKLIRSSGGFITTSSDPILIGQIQIVHVMHAVKAQQAILQHKTAILNLANSLHPKMVARGGGAQDVDVKIYPSVGPKGDMLVVHLYVDTQDAMGANLVNTMCEGVASLLEELTEGKAFLRILSNLTDRSMVTARCTIAVDHLKGKGYSGQEVRDGIVLANQFAMLDAYRAATHNKGIMNGIDAVALATGNDWRAIEAAAHAYAGRGASYTALTKWSEDADGNLQGSIELPLKVGIVCGNLKSNPAVSLSHRLLKVESARQLAEIMGAVGLAQNFAALRALATDGIQQGHMMLHARSVAMSAGASPALFDTVVEQLVQSGEVKVWKAQEIIASLIADHPPQTTTPKATSGMLGHVATEEEARMPVGHGKVILLGEHAVVYGSHALAAAIDSGVRARVEHASSGGVYLLIPAWGFAGHLHAHDTPNALHQSLHLILSHLGLSTENMTIKVYPDIPRAVGLGGSAALAVAVIRALSQHFALQLSDDQINALAFESEKIAHGTPSGVDNTVSTFGCLMLFKRSPALVLQPIAVKKRIPLVIGMSGVESLTVNMVTKVNHAWNKNKSLYDSIFKDIDALVLQAFQAVQGHDLELLGELMNINQGLLNALQISTWQLEELIDIARKHGALGAKLTGKGGGGAMVALCPENPQHIADAMVKAGYQAFVTAIGVAA